MPFASNSNFVAPVTAPDLGNPTKVAPPDLGNGFVPGTPIAAEHVNYLVNRLCPVKQKFTSNGTWTKPSGATTVRIVCVGGGGKGADGNPGQGAAGGAAGEVMEAVFDADELPASLTVTIGAASTTNATGGGATYVQASGITLVCAFGGTTGTGSSATGLPSDVTRSTTCVTLGGSQPAVGAAGNRGQHSRYGAGGSGGVATPPPGPGISGRGYGAGGGGGASTTNGGGSGGGGGYGHTIYAGTATTTGAAGAPGVCYIFTDVDVT